MSFEKVWQTLATDAVSEAEPTSDIDVPAPAARLLAHALGPQGTGSGTRGARLHLSGSVVQGGRRLRLEADEVLVPLRGFAWRATGRLGPARVRVRDHYLEGASTVDVRLFGVLPLGGEHGPDTTASSRGRLVAESLWVPSMLQPQPGVTWSAVDETSAVVSMTVDGVTESMTLVVGDDGRIEQMTMLRWGKVGVDNHQRIPYGFAVNAERSFGAVTIPSDLEGGWWFGTERYDPESASRFVVESLD
jgi:hypothetical protein